MNHENNAVCRIVIKTVSIHPFTLIALVYVVLHIDLFLVIKTEWTDIFW